MNPKQYWSALGSPQLFAVYVSKAAIRSEFVDPYDEYGKFPLRGRRKSGASPPHHR